MAKNNLGEQPFQKNLKYCLLHCRKIDPNIQETKEKSLRPSCRTNFPRAAHTGPCLRPCISLWTDEGLPGINLEQWIPRLARSLFWGQRETAGDKVAHYFCRCLARKESWKNDGRHCWCEAVATVKEFGQASLWLTGIDGIRSFMKDQRHHALDLLARSYEDEAIFWMMKRLTDRSNKMEGPEISGLCTG